MLSMEVSDHSRPPTGRQELLPTSVPDKIPRAMTEVLLDGRSLTLEDVAWVAREGVTARLAPAAVAAIDSASRLVARIVAEERRTYGVNTGFGALSTITIPPEALRELQVNLLRSHAAGVGAALPEAAVRAMLLL